MVSAGRTTVAPNAAAVPRPAAAWSARWLCTPSKDGKTAAAASSASPAEGESHAEAADRILSGEMTTAEKVQAHTDEAAMNTGVYSRGIFADDPGTRPETTSGAPEGQGSEDAAHGAGTLTVDPNFVLDERFGQEMEGTPWRRYLEGDTEMVYYFNPETNLTTRTHPKLEDGTYAWAPPLIETLKATPVLLPDLCHAALAAAEVELAEAKERLAAADTADTAAGAAGAAGAGVPAGAATGEQGAEEQGEGERAEQGGTSGEQRKSGGGSFTTNYGKKAGKAAEDGDRGEDGERAESAGTGSASAAVGAVGKSESSEGSEHGEGVRRTLLEDIAAKEAKCEECRAQLAASADTVAPAWRIAGAFAVDLGATFAFAGVIGASMWMEISDIEAITPGVGLGAWMYFLGRESLFEQGTRSVGKRLLKLEVVKSKDGTLPSRTRGVLRNLYFASFAGATLLGPLVAVLPTLDLAVLGLSRWRCGDWRTMGDWYTFTRVINEMPNREKRLKEHRQLEQMKG
jgi:hypothetical protein